MLNLILRELPAKPSLCPSRKYKNSCSTSDVQDCQPDNIVIDGPGCDIPKEVDTSLVHLMICNMFRYKPTPLPSVRDFPDCPVSSSQMPVRADENYIFIFHWNSKFLSTIILIIWLNQQK